MTAPSLLISLTATLICACSGKTGSEDNAIDSTISIEQTTQVPATNNCFAHQTQKDSAFLNLEIADSTVSGKLSYAFFEKDRNDGTITGTIAADRIFAHYTFTSEGTQSAREVVFRKKGEGWVEGFGEMKDSAGVMIFKDRSKLDFEKGLYFEPVKCPAKP
ncbi:hypothetical protein [Dyadobacter sp. OTU695]|uniref:hypothetical protein n=1 Tax=Dyadobacter sp. OTU695 TaxID=3043860 RepID=UPI00313E3760